jgi:hypothetical protein
MTAARKKWTDFAAKASTQPALFEAPEQPRRRRAGTCKKPSIPERDIQRSIVSGLKSHPDVRPETVERTGVYTGRVVRPNGSIGYAKAGQKGMADICGKLKDGRKFAIEVKRRETRNSLTDEQREFLDDYIKRGDLAGVATSVEEAFAIVEGRA